MEAVELQVVEEAEEVVRLSVKVELEDLDARFAIARLLSVLFALSALRSLVSSSALDLAALDDSLEAPQIAEQASCDP